MTTNPKYIPQFETISSLAEKYKISRQTLSKRIESIKWKFNINKKHKNTKLSPNEVKHIIALLGSPY